VFFSVKISHAIIDTASRMKRIVLKERFVFITSVFSQVIGM